jgi:hypothetical protein
VTELVAAAPPEEQREPRAQTGVVYVGDVATVCVVEDVPSVGDVIRADEDCVVERVRYTRDGRVLIYARPFDDAA